MASSPQAVGTVAAVVAAASREGSNVPGYSLDEEVGGSIHPPHPSQSSQLSHARDGSGGLPIACGGAGGCAHRPSYDRAEACRVVWKRMHSTV